ncbi:MAG: MFS transporter [Eubacteriaceae bacterium]
MDKVKNKAYTYRWIVFALLILAYFFVFFHRLSPAVVKINLQEAFGMTAMQYANLNSAYFYPYAIMQIPVGILADTLGARKTSVIGCVLMALGSIFFGLSPSFNLIIAARILVGLGASVIFLSILKIQASWFEEKEFGTLTGMTTFIGNLGGAGAQGPLAFMVGLLTWRMSFIAIGVFSVVLAVALFIVVRNKPEDKGYEPIVVIKKRENEQEAGILKTLGEILKNKYMWPIIIINFLAMGVNFTITAWSIPYLTDVYGLTVKQAGGITFFYPVAAACGCMFLGIITDKIKMRKLPVIILSIGFLICCALIVFINNGKPPIALFSIALILSGFFLTFSVLFYSVAKDLNNPRFSGMSTSVANTAVFLGAALVPLFFGKIISKLLPTLGAQAAYHKVFLIFIFVGIVCTIISFFLMETNCKNRYYEIKNEEYKKTIFNLK